MLLAVGGESRRIVLGEVPPARTEQEQEPAQDVAAQWLHDDSQEKNRDSKINALSKPKIPVPQPRSRIGKTEEAKSRGIRNRKSRRRCIKGTGNRSSSYTFHIILVSKFISKKTFIFNVFNFYSCTISLISAQIYFFLLYF